MEQKKLRIALIVCVVIFVIAGILCSVFSKDDTVSWSPEKGSRVVISEIMSDNLTYPAPNGKYLDFIEVRNLSAEPVDISKYSLADKPDAIGFTFPDGTIIPGYGYAVCWCDKSAASNEYANFGISKDGGEAIYLYNRANVLVDEVVVPFLNANTSLIRENDTIWEVSEAPSPGYPNTAQGYSQWLKAMGYGNVHVVISEVVTNNTCITTSEQTAPTDYVELVNLGNETVLLHGAYLSNDPEDPLRWQIPDITLEPGEREIIFCAGTGDGSVYAPFALSKSGCTVTLTGNLGNTLSQVVCPSLENDQAWVLGADGSYSTTNYATPGFENNESGYELWLASIGLDSMQVIISEVMTSNHSTLLSTSRTLCDWVELQNIGSSAVTLDNTFLTDDPEERGKWQLPAITLEPGERTVILCVGNEAQAGEANFGLTKSNGSVLLCGPQGNIISHVQYPLMEDDNTWALQADGTYTQTDLPSPGFENTENGYLSYRASQSPIGPLVIAEVMTSNDRYLIQSDGKYYDWVELVNTSANSINLGDYYLSNDKNDLAKFRLPNRTLESGERIVLICSANENLVGKYIQVPFTLSNDSCWIYVSNSRNELCDSIRAGNIPHGCSSGRVDGENGMYYFETPTPGTANGAGVVFVSAPVQLLTADGIYNNVSSLSIQFQGSGTVHYTLNGSEPTAEDPILTSALTLTKTTVVRAVNIEHGKMPSEVVTACFIINENHTLPVINLTVSANDFFGENGIYTQNNFDSELACNLKLYDGENTLSINCGVTLAGNRANNPDKKSFKLNFRGRYGNKVLGYPLFGENGPQVFDCVSLSAGSDEGHTLFRDELFSELCTQMDGNLYSRQAKHCVLYINGEYWGIYSLKEALGEMYYSQNANVSAASVEEEREPAQFGSEIYKLAEYCQNHNLSQTENYEYIRANIDIDALIDWMILQGYSCNRNIGENLRYFRSSENGGLWTPVLSDLDGAFYYRDGFANVFAENQPWSYLKLTRALMQNQEFRSLFLQRLQKLSQGVLSSENVLAVIDKNESLLLNEMERETNRWGGSVDIWQSDVQRLRTFIVRYDHWAMLAESLKSAIGLTPEEIQQYF